MTPRPWSDLTRQVLVVVGVTLAVAALSVVLSLRSFLYPPGPGGEAKHRLAVITDVPLGDFSALGLGLTDESATPGSPASGFMADSPNPVEVRRTYRHDGEALPVCEQVLTSMDATGWKPRMAGEGCSYFASSNTARLELTYPCADFEVFAEIRVEARGPALPGETTVTVSTRYPDAEWKDKPGKGQEPC